MTKPDTPRPDPADELVALLDSLAEAGSQHIRVTAGEELCIQTVRSSECALNAPCAADDSTDDETNQEESLQIKTCK